MAGEDELKNFIKVWITVIISLAFCYFTIKPLPKGIPRLLALLPVITLFAFLPLQLSSVHFIVTTAGFVTWLGSSKLILFALDRGPLASDPSMSLVHFISAACLPIQIKHGENRTQHQFIKRDLKMKAYIQYPVKVLIIALLIKIYDYKHVFNPMLTVPLSACFIYLTVEIVLTISAFPARVLFGSEIEPQFDDPYLATSLQDFWGKRWNLVIANILKPTVFYPIKDIFRGVLGNKWALVVAVMASFVVSGFMHELILYYLSHRRPSWEITYYFIFQGMCTCAEVLVKIKLGGRWQLHPMISRVLTIGFLILTTSWLFYNPLIRIGIEARGMREYTVLFKFIKSIFL